MKKLAYLLAVVCLSLSALGQRSLFESSWTNGAVNQVATPTFDNDSGSYAGSVTVTMSDATSGATIYKCEASGADCSPAGGSTTNPVTISSGSNHHLCAYATHAGMTDSATKCAAYTITGGGTSVTKIGSCTSTVSSCSITASSGVSAGHGVVIVVATAGTPTSTFSATDNASTPNTYQTDIRLISNSEPFGVLSGAITNAIPSSGNIAITFSTGSETWTAAAYDVSVMKSSAWLDQQNSGTISYGASWVMPSTAATAHQPNVDIAVFTSSQANTVTVPGPWAMLEGASGFTGTAGPRYVWVTWREATATGAQTVTATATADNPNGGIVSYKEN